MPSWLTPRLDCIALTPTSVRVPNLPSLPSLMLAAGYHFQNFNTSINWRTPRPESPLRSVGLGSDGATVVGPEGGTFCAGGGLPGNFHVFSGGGEVA